MANAGNSGPLLWRGILVVPAGKLKAEVEQTFGVQFGIDHRLRIGERLEVASATRPACRFGNLQLIVVLRVRLQSGNEHHSRIVVLERSRDRPGRLIQLFRIRSVQDRELTRTQRSSPDPNAVGGNPAENRTVRDHVFVDKVSHQVLGRAV